MSNVALTLHHLTDLHVGPLHHKPTALPLMRDYFGEASYLDYYLRFLEPRQADLDIVIISGDFTSFASEEEFNKASDFLDNLTERLSGIPTLLDPTLPRICIVPGNHDLDWSKEDNLQKLDRFRRLCRNRPRVVSPFHQQPFVFYAQQNILVWCFNSCSLGGTVDPEIGDIVNRLRGVPGTTPIGELKHQIERLDKLSRQDPGFIDGDELGKLAALPKGHEQMFKIAVMHHNPSMLPAMDVDRYQAILNGGFVKQSLQRFGFDLILHGHRHYPHCAYEEYIGDKRIRSGIYAISGGALGCLGEHESRWFEIQIQDSASVSEESPPSSLVSVYSAVSSGQSYQVHDSPTFRMAIGKKVSGHLRCIHERLGRRCGREDDRIRIRAALSSMRLPLLRLQADVDDWDDGGTWQSVFHSYLPRFSFIYGTDLLGPASWLNPAYLDYLARQFAARMERRSNPTELTFSKEVCAAIARTRWKPNPQLIAERNIESDLSRLQISERDSNSTELEIARILIWPEKAEQEIAIIRMIEHFHQLFGVPVFIITANAVSAENPLSTCEIVLGADSKRDPIRCYRYRLDDPDETQDAGNEESLSIQKHFLGLLANPQLRTLQSILEQN